jgi:hypothetical protein
VGSPSSDLGLSLPGLIGAGLWALRNSQKLLCLAAGVLSALLGPLPEELTQPPYRDDRMHLDVPVIQQLRS